MTQLSFNIMGFFQNFYSVFFFSASIIGIILSAVILYIFCKDRNKYIGYIALTGSQISVSLIAFWAAINLFYTYTKGYSQYITTLSGFYSIIHIIVFVGIVCTGAILFILFLCICCCNNIRNNTDITLLKQGKSLAKIAGNILILNVTSFITSFVIPENNTTGTGLIDAIVFGVMSVLFASVSASLYGTMLLLFHILYIYFFLNTKAQQNMQDALGQAQLLEQIQQNMQDALGQAQLLKQIQQDALGQAQLLEQTLRVYTAAPQNQHQQHLAAPSSSTQQ